MKFLTNIKNFANFRVNFKITPESRKKLAMLEGRQYGQMIDLGHPECILIFLFDRNTWSREKRVQNFKN